MKTFRPLAIAAFLTLGAALGAQASPGHDHSPKHGGVVAEGKTYDYELVARPDRLQLYVRGHGTTPDLASASAKLTLLAAGGQKQEVQLRPAGDRLEAQGTFPVGPGAKAVAVVTVGGKASTARFTLR